METVEPDTYLRILVIFLVLSFFLLLLVAHLIMLWDDVQIIIKNAYCPTLTISEDYLSSGVLKEMIVKKCEK